MNKVVQEEFVVSKFISATCVFQGILALANSASAAPPVSVRLAINPANAALVAATTNVANALLPSPQLGASINTSASGPANGPMNASAAPPSTIAIPATNSLPTTKSAAFAPPVTQFLNCSSQEGGISFTVSESLVQGAYDHSGAVLTYEGITYEISKYETGYDQEVGRTNIATLFSVGIPSTNPGVFFTIDIPRSQTSLALTANPTTSILMGAKKFSAICRTL